MTFEPVSVYMYMYISRRKYTCRNVINLPIKLPPSNTVNGTCSECGNDSYCGCSTNFECRCRYGFTGESGSCEGNQLHQTTLTITPHSPSHHTHHHTTLTITPHPSSHTANLLPIQISMNVSTHLFVTIRKVVCVTTPLEAMTVPVLMTTPTATCLMDTHMHV